LTLRFAGQSQSQRLRILGCELDVLVFGDLVAFDDVRLLDFVARLGIHLAVANAVTGLFVELIEADLLPLGSRRIKGDGTRDQRARAKIKRGDRKAALP
jgi:hypothetical protein